MEHQKTALVSVYNKDGIVEFVKDLIDMRWRVIASGGTARVLTEAGLQVTDVASLSGMGPILDHRVVTLVPEIHGGLLALPKHFEELESLGIPWIDLVCVDLYPLAEEIKKRTSTRESIIEKTDIGGPTMLRSGAKGLRIVVCDPRDRQRIVKWIKKGEPNKEEVVRCLQGKAEAVVAEYCLRSGVYQLRGKKDIPMEIGRYFHNLVSEAEHRIMKLAS